MAVASANPKTSKKSGGTKGQQSSTKAGIAKKAYLSEELIADSDDEDAASGDKNSKTTNAHVKLESKLKRSDVIPTKVNGVKRKSTEQSSSSGESEEDSDSSESASQDESHQRHTKKAKVIKTPQPVEDNSSHDEEEGEDEDDGEEDLPDVDTSAAVYAQGPYSKLKSTLADNPRRSSSTGPKGTVPASSTFASIPAQEFKPPSGYTALDSQALKSSLLSEADLTGKQIWHICAPANMPLDSIREFTLAAAKTATPVISHKGVDYNWSESADDQCVVFLPGRDGFAPTKQKIGKKLHLQQIINLPNLSARQASQVTGSSAAANIALASVSTIRSQPKGLRMRYKPPGFGVGEPGAMGFDAESEKHDDGESSLQFPKTLGGAAEEQTELPLAASKKKSKKCKDNKLRVDGVQRNGDVGVHREHGALASKGESSPMKEETSETKDSSMVNGTEVLKPSKEERVRRKEAKRVKKEAKKEKPAIF